LYNEDALAAREFEWCPGGIFGGNKGIYTANDEAKLRDYLKNYSTYFAANKYTVQKRQGAFKFRLGMDYPITRFNIFCDDPGNSPTKPIIAAWGWDHELDQPKGTQPKYCIWYGDKWGTMETIWLDKSPDGNKLPNFSTGGLAFNKGNKSFRFIHDATKMAPYWDAWKAYARGYKIARAPGWRELFPLP
jgi:hypothetical protein